MASKVKRKILQDDNNVEENDTAMQTESHLQLAKKRVQYSLTCYSEWGTGELCSYLLDKNVDEKCVEAIEGEWFI